MRNTGSLTENELQGGLTLTRVREATRPTRAEAHLPAHINPSTAATWLFSNPGASAKALRGSDCKAKSTRLSCTAQGVSSLPSGLPENQPGGERTPHVREGDGAQAVT